MMILSTPHSTSITSPTFTSHYPILAFAFFFSFTSTEIPFSYDFSLH